MEFPDIGQRCSFLECNQLDFLPFVCAACKLVFCSDHRLPASHTCQSQDCGKEDLPASGIPHASCVVDACQSKGAKTTCELCQESCCLRHRHPQDHSCHHILPQKPHSTETPNEKVERIIGRQLVPKKKGNVTSAAAVKVMLMKLKMKAIGDKSIPQDERVYVNVTNQSDTGSSTHAVFLNKTWRIGKCVDSVAHLLRLKNDNHLANSKKLRLFSVGEVMLSTDETLIDVMQRHQDVYNGSEVHVRYI